MSNAEPAQKPTERPAPRRIWGRLLIAIGLFVASFLISWSLRLNGSDTPADEHAALDDAKRQTADEAIDRDRKEHAAELAEPALDRLERGDRYLREHNESAALGLYKRLLADATATAAGPLHYRIGQCQERLGNTEKALAAYRRAASDAGFPHGLAVAQLGQARVLVRMQRREEAKALLYPLLLAATPPIAAERIHDARYLLALIHGRAALPEPPARPFNATSVTPMHDPVDIPGDLRELRAALPPKVEKPDVASKAAPAFRAPLVIEQAAPPAGKIVVHARFAALPAIELFEVVAKTAGLRIEWTAHAKEALKDRTGQLALERWDLADLLLSLADTLDLVCQLDGDLVRLATPHEASKEAIQAFRVDLARRALIGVLQSSPNHRLAPAGQLLMGNLEAVAGNAPQAVVWYEKILCDRPTSPLAVYANYNLGILHADCGDYAAARKAFFRALDRSPGHELAPAALLQVGRMHLEEGSIGPGLTSLRRARTVSPGAACQPLTALTLAAGSLLAEQARPAVEALAELRGQLKQEPFRATAILLDAMARYRIAREKGAARLEAADLVAALARVRGPDHLGAIETCLRCRALRDLGLWREITVICAEALPHARGPLVPDLQIALGEALLQTQRPAEAALMFQLVARRKEARWQALAGHRLAEVDLQEGRSRACIARCEQLWKEVRWIEATATLRLWGAAYEQLGEHDKAAQCFAGTPPL